MHFNSERASKGYPLEYGKHGLKWSQKCREGLFLDYIRNMDTTGCTKACTKVMKHFEFCGSI